MSNVLIIMSQDMQLVMANGMRAYSYIISQKGITVLQVVRNGQPGSKTTTYLVNPS
ncbi:MAG: hypothetical protein WCA39_07130 [Nitrososphaeraceae archaeon]